MPQIPEDSFLGSYAFKGHAENEDDLNAGYSLQWRGMGDLIELHASTISTGFRIQMFQTGCSYEEAATAFLQKCDEALTTRYILDLKSIEEEKAEKRK